MRNRPAFAVIVCFSLLVLFSCSPTRHWRAVATDKKVTEEKRAIIAPKVAILFPAREIFIPGQVITKTDTVVDIDQVLEMAAVVDSLLFLIKPDVNIDSLRKTILSRFKPRTVRVTQTSIDTIQVPNAAREYALQSEIEQRNGEIAQLKGDKVILEKSVAKLEKEVKKWYEDKWFWLFVFCAVGWGVSTFIHIKR